MSYLKVIIYLTIIFVFVGCNNSNKIDLSATENEIKSLEEKISNLQTDIVLINSNLNKHESAVFDPASGKSFQRVDTTSGIFLISVQDVTPYLDGVKVKLNIGNIQSSVYTDFKLIMNYGQRYPKFDSTQSSDDRKKKLDEYENSLKEKTESFSKELKEGSWNRVTTVLPGIKPTEFGRLEISMTTNTVRLKVN